MRCAKDSPPLSDNIGTSTQRSQSQNSAYDEPRPAKRMKYRACDSCVTSKTRCDDVLPAGCLVCRRRNKPCSLAGIASRDVRLMSTSAPLTEETNAELRSRLEMVEARSWDLEQRMKAMEAGPRTMDITPGSTSLQAVSTTRDLTPANDRSRTEHERVEIDLYMAGIANKPQISVFDERMMYPINIKGYPCAIQRGLVTRDQVDMAFQVFKHRFSSLLPLPHFLLSSTPTPSHPFVVLTILTHVPGFASPEIHALIDESLAHASTGAAEDEALLALLILSLQPFRRERLLGWSPVRLIALAYDMGKGKGFEAMALSGIRHKERLCEQWWFETLDKILLWEAIKTQYNLIHLGLSAINSLVECHASRLPEHPVDRYRETIDHLRVCSAFFSIVSPFVRALGDAVAEIAYSHIDLDSLFKLWSPIPLRADTLIRQHPLLQVPIRTTLFTLGLRTTMHVQSIPVPVFPEHKALGNTWIYEQMLRTAFTVIDIFVNLPQRADLPKTAMMIVVIAVACGSRVMHFFPTVEDAKHVHHVTFKNVPRAHDMLLEMGGVQAMAYEKLHATFSDVSLYQKRVVASIKQSELESRTTAIPAQDELSVDPTGQPFDPNDLSSIFNLDFESWESLLGAYRLQDNNLLFHDPQAGWQGV